MFLQKIKYFYIKYLRTYYYKIFFFLRILLPKTLFSRIFVILASVVFVVQVSIIIVFYDNYWRSINNSLIKDTAHDIAKISLKFNQSTSRAELNNIINNANAYSKFYLESVNSRSTEILNVNKNKSNILLITELQSLLPNNTILITNYEQGFIDTIYISTAFNTYVAFNLKNSLLISGSISYLVLITSFFYIITLLITWQFFRLQTRPLKILAKAAKNFANNKKSKYIVPSGALEIRQTTLAFNDMFNQIEQFIDQRTMMLSSVSHDLKTSLTKMTLAVELSEDNELKQDLLEEIQSMNQMIASYLEFAKSNFIEEEFEKVEIKKFFKSLKHQHETETFKIDLEFLQSTNNFDIHLSSMHRCFDNLIDNARKFANYLQIKIANYSNHSIIITLSDNGIGILEENLENVFKPFYKLDNARTSVNGSVGLGLYIVKDIITKNQGNIYLSKSEFNGLKVNIILPIQNHEISSKNTI